MQPATTNTKATATANAAGDLQLEIGGDEDSPDSAEKPASHISSTHRSGSLASTQTITPATANHRITTTPQPKTPNGINRMFRAGDSTPRAGSATPSANGTEPYVTGAAGTASAGGAATTAFSGTAPIKIDKSPHHQHLPQGAITSMSTGTGTTMIGGTGSSHSVSPTSTLPTPSEYCSPPASPRPNSQPGSRKSSFSERAEGKAANGTPSVNKTGSVVGSDGGATQSVGGQRFTLKDLLATGPKLARKPSQSSRKSDTSSDRAGGYAESTTTSLLKKYGVCEKIAIGKGATSVVRLAHKWDRSEEKLFAVKEFRKRRKNETEKEYVKKLTAEFCISSTLHHVNIVETVDLVQDEQHHWCEVMEYCPGGDLYAAIKKGQMSSSEIECCFKQLLTGVAYLHSQGVAHRDIKPENLFFNTCGHLKIGDYGASTVYRLPWESTVHMSTGLCGSEPYIAPEQFLRKPYDARLVDIWAVGVVYYCLLFQELPWRVAQPCDSLFAAYQSACAATPFKVSVASSANAPTSQNLKDGAPPRSTTSSSSSLRTMHTFPPTINNIEPRDARPLLRRILEPDPKLRANVQEIMDNVWLKSIEVCTEVKRPRHQHANIRAALRQPVAPLSSDTGSE